VSSAALLYATGLFTLVLGLVHFWMPVLFDFRGAIPLEGADLTPFRLTRIRYRTRRSDVYGIAWVMNHAASYTLVTIGALDLTWPLWLATPFGTLVSVWIAGFWFLRAGSQLYLGRRRGDLWILAAIALLGVVHLAALIG
jgi:hypothetical protein